MEAKMQPKKDVVKSQKKFRYFKDQNPIYLLETFQHNNKTHYVISSSSILYIGYMEKNNFNQIINYNPGSYACSFCVFEDTMYFGMKNGSLVVVSLEQAYNQIPFKRVESVDGMAVLGICVVKKETEGKVIYTISQDDLVKVYRQVEEGFKFCKSVKIDCQFHKIVSKNSLSDQTLPCFMIQLKTTTAYPILLTIQQIDKLLHNTTDFLSLVQLRKQVYLEDEKLHSILASMDFDTGKMIATLGYTDGSIEILKIEKKEKDDEIIFFLSKELRFLQRENIIIICVSIFSDPQCPYVSFVSESNFSGMNYEMRSAPFAKIKVDKEKDITTVRWTKNKHFLAASLSTEEKKRLPKLYCIEQELPEDA